MRLRKKTLGLRKYSRYQECQRLRWAVRALNFSARLACVAGWRCFCIGGGSTTRAAQAQDSNDFHHLRRHRRRRGRSSNWRRLQPSPWTRASRCLRPCARCWRPDLKPTSAPKTGVRFRAQLRDRMQHQEGPAVEAVRAFYKEHVSADPEETLSRYLWFGLVAGPAPDFKPTMRREDLPPEVLALEGFSELLSKYYQEQGIGQLWRQMQPAYNREIERMHDAVSQIVFVAGAYLRSMQRPDDPSTFTIIVEPLVGRITNVRNFGDHYAIVLSGADDVPADVVRHAYLHFLLDPLPLRFSHVVAVKRPLFEKAAAAPRLPPDLKDDYPAFFAECTVRAVELKLKKMSPGERDAAFERADADGYVLVRPLFTALQKFEASEPSMALYFPDLVRAVDVTAELKRVSALQFAAADIQRKPGSVANEEVARRRAAALPSTVPNDPEAIAALTEGERRIAEKIPEPPKNRFREWWRNIRTSREHGTGWDWWRCWTMTDPAPRKYSGV